MRLDMPSQAGTQLTWRGNAACCRRPAAAIVALGSSQYRTSQHGPKLTWRGGGARCGGRAVAAAAQRSAPAAA